MKGDNLRKNASGYSDPTAYQAIMNADKDASSLSFKPLKNKMLSASH